MAREQVVFWQTQAPAKPAVGAPCNGCGLCCLAEPCPMGMLISRRCKGACAALRWDEEALHYRCGVLEDARRAASHSSAWRRGQGRLRLALARRWIVAGVGCDAYLWAEPVG
ncbi:MAG: hypothetical protein LBJ15_19075 [Comamonas sp.]|jgi:hypothetical protein|uniref:hypothetical protein n=1 Tax=Comamonas sp. TaxID=34028 RepID=UPI00281BFBC3|nr:hypothetical protein [Comamonas sp.]MDR0216079.1 hypothetical protein [Comamonas sp.]